MRRGGQFCCYRKRRDESFIGDGTAGDCHSIVWNIADVVSTFLKNSRFPRALHVAVVVVILKSECIYTRIFHIWVSHIAIVQDGGHLNVCSKGGTAVDLRVGRRLYNIMGEEMRSQVMR